MRFEDEVASLQPQVDKLRTLGVDKVVALGHSGFHTDQEIARRVRGVDVVVGGHTNTFLYTGGSGTAGHIWTESDSAPGVDRVH